MAKGINWLEKKREKEKGIDELGVDDVIRLDSISTNLTPKKLFCSADALGQSWTYLENLMITHKYIT